MADPVARVEDSVPSAVLVPLLERDGEARLVLTKRPETMRWHRGEIVFPGGKFDPSTDHDLRDTALREAREEIGLRPEDVEIVSRLDGVATVASRFTIAPYVGFLRGEPVLTPNPVEVDRVFDVPLSELMDHEVYREERWDMFEADHPMPFYELADETVWGATARILTDFLAHLAAGYERIRGPYRGASDRNMTIEVINRVG